MVGRSCCVKNCHNKSHNRSGKLGNGLRFFSFPSWKRNEGKKIEDLTKRRRMAWVAAVRRKAITFRYISATMLVCSLHFQKGKPAYEMLETDPDWAPSLYLGHNEITVPEVERFARQSNRHQHQKESEERAQQEIERAQREAEMVQREAERAQQEAEERAHREAEERAHREAEERAHREAEERAHREAEETVEDCNMCRLRCAEINRLLEENRELKRELDEHRMTDSDTFFNNDDGKVKYYTGLPSFGVFLVLLNHVIAFLPQHRRVLSPFRMLLLTFMRLRLDLPAKHIAYLFNVNRSTVYAAFNDTLSVLHTRLSPIVHWPDRESLRASMPHQFVEAFGNHVAVIVDCFEVFTEKPSNLKARAQTFSSYKHHHTMKYMIGITPQGVISFISKGWGGRTSDKHVTENSGFLEKLLPGDVILADRGFDIKESVGMMCAEVKIPAFTRGRYQLDAKDVEGTRAIAHLRIHVERVIGNLSQKYTILTGTIPISMVLPCVDENVTILDKIVIVCCALTNMCPSVV